jgi:hypothetical protein
LTLTGLETAAKFVNQQTKKQFLWLSVHFSLCF